VEHPFNVDSLSFTACPPIHYSRVVDGG